MWRKRKRTEVKALVERFNKILSERLFGYQYAGELCDLSNKNRTNEWVVSLPEVVSAINNKVTRLIGQKCVDAIKEKSVHSESSKPLKHNEKEIPYMSNVRYLYQPGELENGQRFRATDPIWSLKIYGISRFDKKKGEPILYYLRDGPNRAFVREELLIVPSDTHNHAHK